MRTALNRSVLRALLPIAAYSLLLIAPAPPDIAASAWNYFALFFAVILALVIEPLPAAAVGFLGVTAAMVLGHVGATPRETVAWGLSGFSNATVWLIFGAFVLSLGYRKSGLGVRLALLLVKTMGKRTIGLGYAVALADLLMAPVTPSNTARSAGTLYPILRNIPELFGSEPGPTARRIGSYLMWTAFATTAVTSSMFLTGLAPNLLAITFVKQSTGIEITWLLWLKGFLPVGLVLFGLTPLLVYLAHPPQIRRSEKAPEWASGQLKQLGRLTGKEAVMTLLVVLALGLWIFGRSFVHAAVVTWIVISLMVLTRIVEWDDILGSRAAWNMLVWFATLVALADGLKRVGFIDGVTARLGEVLAGFPPVLILACVVIFFFLIHYLFASLTAHTTALLPVLLGLGTAVPGVPVLPFSLLLCYSLGLMGVITPYATGPAPVYYGCGFITRIDFWRLGLIFGLINLSALLLIGIPYLTAFF